MRYTKLLVTAVILAVYGASLGACTSSTESPAESGPSQVQSARITNQYEDRARCTSDGPALSTHIYDVEAETGALLVGHDSEPTFIRSNEVVYIREDALPNLDLAGDWVRLGGNLSSDELRLLSKTRLLADSAGLLVAVEDPFLGLQELVDSDRSVSSPLRLDDLTTARFVLSDDRLVESLHLELDGVSRREATAVSVTRLGPKRASETLRLPVSAQPLTEVPAWSVLSMSDDLLVSCNSHESRLAVTRSRACVRDLAGVLTVGQWLDRHGPITLPIECA